jgi:hypothetical protein
MSSEASQLLDLFKRVESAEFFCRHFKEDRDRALAERDAALAKVSAERARLCRLFTNGCFMIRQNLPSSIETVSLTTETAIQLASSMEPLP